MTCRGTAAALRNQRKAPGSFAGGLLESKAHSNQLLNSSTPAAFSSLALSSALTGR